MMLAPLRNNLRSRSASLFKMRTLVHTKIAQRTYGSSSVVLSASSSPRATTDMQSTQRRRTVYLNGSYRPEYEASVSVFDRGFLMADAVYEVTCVLDGKLIDFDAHMKRLERSLQQVEMAVPATMKDFLGIHRELVERNHVKEGVVYLQITRGSDEDRSFLFPPKDCPHTVLLFTQEMKLIDNPLAERGLRIVSIPDMRWKRRDIKTTQLLWQSMGKMQANKAGVDDAWMIEDGFVTEGTSSNAYIVKGNTITTRHLGTDILHGITRASVLRFASENDILVDERPFSIQEAQQADEAFVTSSSSFLLPVVEIDGKEIGSGKPGTVSQQLRRIYIEEGLKAAI